MQCILEPHNHLDYQTSLCRRRPALLHRVAGDLPAVEQLQLGHLLAATGVCSGQRGWKTQPGGGRNGEGSSPTSLARGAAPGRVGDRGGGQERPGVGVLRLRRRCVAGALSTARPRYMTITSSAKWCTTDRLWETNR